MTHRFRRITTDMTHSRAALEFEEYRKLSLDENGWYNPDGVLDQIRVDYALDTGKAMTRAEARVVLKQKQEAFAGETEAESLARFTASLQPNPDLVKAADYALRLVTRWHPEIWDIEAKQRGPQLGRLEAKLRQLGWSNLGWIINEVARLLIKGKWPQQ